MLVADDQALIRDAFATLIGLEPDMTVVAQVGSGDAVLPAAERERPDVALLDVQMQRLDGLAAAALLADRVPSCRVVILTTFGRPGYGCTPGCGRSTPSWPRKAWPWASRR